MSDLTYKGFTGSANVSIEDNCLHGKVLFIDDIITYEGATVEELNGAFKEAVDDYVSYCERAGKSPNKPYSGTFNVRIGAELHRKAAEASSKNSLNLNEYVVKAVQELVERNGITKVEHIHKHEVTVKGEPQREVRVATTTRPSSWEPIYARTH